ncbi:hypothetical protein [Vulgatibacter sp.]|uniref:hypothetical protein n=1 Tax=Vulgatibacter sp. TaxID=1971226 RepID=UPI003567B616
MTKRTERCRRLIFGCAAIAGLWGCGAEEALEAQRRELAAEQQVRMAALEQLEARLVAVGARQRAWSELQERHTRISAIACENVAEHVAAMEKHDEKQRAKRRRSARRLADAQARVESAARPAALQRVAVDTAAVGN